MKCFTIVDIIIPYWLLAKERYYFPVFFAKFIKSARRKLMTKRQTTHCSLEKLHFYFHEPGIYMSLTPFARVSGLLAPWRAKRMPMDF